MTTEEAVARYYDAWQTKHGDLADVPLADDFEFTGPIASFDSAEGYRAMAREAGRAVTSFEVRRQFVDLRRLAERRGDRTRHALHRRAPGPGAAARASQRAARAEAQPSAAGGLRAHPYRGARPRRLAVGDHLKPRRTGQPGTRRRPHPAAGVTWSRDASGRDGCALDRFGDAEEAQHQPLEGVRGASAGRHARGGRRAADERRQPARRSLGAKVDGERIHA